LNLYLGRNVFGQLVHADNENVQFHPKKLQAGIYLTIMDKVLGFNSNLWPLEATFKRLSFDHA
jgi:hypothetical protein